VSARTEQALGAALDRLSSGRPWHTDGKLTKNILWREAGVSRAALNRATALLAEWDARAATSPGRVGGRQRDQELAER
jgi:hypothetical protein